MKFHWRLALILSAGLTLLNQVAWACPQCASREGGGYGGVLLLGGMILSPFLVAMISWRVIRRLTDTPESVGVIESEYGGMA